MDQYERVLEYLDRVEYSVPQKSVSMSLNEFE